MKVRLRSSLAAAAVIAVWSFEARADIRGNGGDLVVCRDGSGKIVSTEMLDYFEGRVLRGLTPSFSSSTNDPTELALDVVNRLARLDRHRAEAYRPDVAGFVNNAQFLSGVTLTDIPDSEHLVMPEGCAVEQFAIRHQPEFPGDRTFLVNRDLWNASSVATRAGLLLHEVIYGEMIANGQQNSIKARYYNSVVTSAKLDGMSREDYVALLQTVSLAFVPEEPLPTDMPPADGDNDPFNFTACSGNETWNANDVVSLLPAGSNRTKLTAKAYVRFASSTCVPRPNGATSCGQWTDIPSTRFYNADLDLTYDPTSNSVDVAASAYDIGSYENIDYTCTNETGDLCPVYHTYGKVDFGVTVARKDIVFAFPKGEPASMLLAQASMTAQNPTTVEVSGSYGDGHSTPSVKAQGYRLDDISNQGRSLEDMIKDDFPDTFAGKFTTHVAAFNKKCALTYFRSIDPTSPNAEWTRTVGGLLIVWH